MADTSSIQDHKSLTLPARRNRDAERSFQGAEASLAVWRQMMKADPEALPYQSPEWVEAACKVGGYESISRLYTDEDGARFVLPLVRKAGLPRQLATISSMPAAWGMGGLVGEAQPSPQLIRNICQDLRQLGYLAIRIRPNPRHGAVWAAAGPTGFLPTKRRAHVIDLRDGIDHLWSNGFTARTRNNINKAERRGVEVRYDDTGQFVTIFNALFERSIPGWAKAQNEPLWLARWRNTQRDPISKLEAITHGLGKMCRIGVAFVEDAPAAAVLVLQAENVNQSRAVMDKRLVGNLGANEYLIFRAIRNAAEAGCNFYHMGESGNSETLSHFKEKFGAQPVEYAEYRHERLPVSRIDQMARTAVKRAIGFKDLG